ncbi:MAG: YwbE family protein [Crocinitomicaceae bacterium]
MPGTKRNNIEIGMEVEVVLKKDQLSGELTHGFVKRILTKSKFHPHGIKVMLDDGKVGRVKNIISEIE